MKVVSAIFAHLGKIYTHNEDNFYYHGSILNEIDSKMYFDKQICPLDKQGVLFGVFDGMGGISFGEKASFIAANLAMKQFASFEPDRISDLFHLYCHNANDEICREIVIGKSKMGSTTAMLHLSNESYTVCNIGDSPVYVFRDGILSLVSVEHSEKVLYEHIYGTVTENKKYKLTQHLGIFDDEMSIEPHIDSGGVYLGDKFLLCSDGLSDLVDFETIRQIISKTIAPDEIASLLLDLALDNGGCDNITIICIEIKA